MLRSNKNKLLTLLKKLTTASLRKKERKMSEPTEIASVKDWLTFLVAVIACVSGIIFWVQSSNDPRFEKIEKEITILREDIKSIRTNNSEILRIVGKLEGKLENQ